MSIVLPSARTRARSRCAMPAGAGAVEAQRAVDPHLLRARVDAEGIAGPEHDVRVLARLERADAIVETERPRRIDGDPLDRLVGWDGQAGRLPRRHRLGRLLVEALRAGRIVGVHDDAGTGGEEDGGVGLDAVQRFHLEAAPVGPDRAGDLLAREQVGDLVGLDTVVERADLVAELLRDVDHLRHLVGAVAVVVHEDVAAQHLGQRLHREIALRRIALLVRVPLVPLAAVLFGLDPGARDSRPRCPCASTDHAARTRASGSRRTPSSARTSRRGTSSPARCAPAPP